MVKFIKRLTLIIILLISLIFAFSTWLLFTELGSQLIRSAVNHYVPVVNIDSIDGALLTESKIEGITVKSDGLSIRVQELQLKLNIKSLFMGRVSADKLYALGVYVGYQDNTDDNYHDDSTEKDESAPFRFPITIDSPDIKLTDVSLDILGTKLNWQSLNTGLKLQRQNIIVTNGQWHTIGLQLPADPKPDPKNTTANSNSKKSSSTKSTSPMVLPEVVLPLTIKLDNLDITQFIYQGTEGDNSDPVIVNRLQITAFAKDEDISINKMKLDMADLDLEGKAAITLKDNYPLALNLNSRFKDSTLKDYQVILKTKGDLTDLDVDSKLTTTKPSKTDLSLTGQVNLLDPNIPFDAVLVSRYFQWPLQGQADYQLHNSNVSVQGDLTRYGYHLSTTAEGKEIPKAKLAASGSGDIDQIKLDQLKLDGLGGTIQGRAHFSWQYPMRWGGS
ncbi:hypothetical protein L0B53_08295 [Vibrio sp. SS-MA-C1-2]|uniref:hypothetical protein n=1 Tax=Vibrio sp. SS-MA-C1-2 TaxID=2908646 RepID=UPI001F267277|nr:hypothetical protein [Vibrio sp. SS-MA-C1-2]UJF19512.1 hypothetical protein L0B53_08295 [Vibrio sp. SS-MA-C1-2]